jgi:hypothetical protein
MISLALAGLFVVSLAAPATADDASNPYLTPQKIAELRAKYRASYDGCVEAMREVGWNSLEIYAGCSWRHSHMRVTNRMALKNDPVSYRP